MKLHDDSWLAGILGCPCFRVDAEHGSSIPSVFEHARAFCFTKIPTSDVELVRDLGRHGFFVTDVNITFSRTVEGPVETSSKAIVRDHESSHAEDVLRIAESSFRFSRFHLDPLIPKEIADKIKREWIANYVRGQRGDRLFVATVDGRVAGFLAALRSSDAAVIDLVATGDDYRRHGVGEALCAAFINHYRTQCKQLLVGTQVSNVPSSRLYEKLGFKLSKSDYVMHLHVRNGRAA
jgi:ribosomal protein S18 acetylase RimI-like enzyme